MRIKNRASMSFFSTISKSDFVKKFLKSKKNQEYEITLTTLLPTLIKFGEKIATNSI